MGHGDRSSLQDERKEPAHNEICMTESPVENRFLHDFAHKRKTTLTKSTIKPPAHISTESKKWFASVLDDYELQDHEIKLLILACEAFDRATSARETIAKCGAYYNDRFGSPRKHPAVSVLEAATIAFARLTRELSLTDTAPDDNRPPPIKSNRGY
jgi:P27 family predicted phage terminase small subunit